MKYLYLDKKNDVSEMLISWTIVLHQTPDFKRNCHTEFGSYAQTHENAIPKNNTDKEITVRAIDLETMNKN